MARVRSPSYPSSSLEEALEKAGKLYSANRNSAMAREAAAKDLGYAGLSGRSGKVLANLAHYGLVEKAGKGGIRVSQLAVDILYPQDQQTKERALREAALNPSLFADMHEQFGTRVSENVIRSYLMREGFADVAIGPAVSSYLETCGLLEQETAGESHRTSTQGSDIKREPETVRQAQLVDLRPSSHAEHPPVQQRPREVGLMEGERVVFVEEAAPAQYMKIVASGELDETLLDALTNYIDRQKRRIRVSEGKKQVDKAASEE